VNRSNTKLLTMVKKGARREFGDLRRQHDDVVMVSEDDAGEQSYTEFRAVDGRVDWDICCTALALMVRQFEAVRYVLVFGAGTSAVFAMLRDDAGEFRVEMAPIVGRRLGAFVHVDAEPVDLFRYQTPPDVHVEEIGEEINDRGDFGTSAAVVVGGRAPGASVH
jgi:hypothetical protein